MDDGFLYFGSASISDDADVQRVIGSRGGRKCLHSDERGSFEFDLCSTLENKFRWMLLWAQPRYFVQRQRQLQWCVTGAPIPNAFSSLFKIDPPIDFIGISYGLACTVVELYWRILADPGTFPDVGEPAVESLAPLTFLTHDSLPLKEARPWRQPVCTIRGHFAKSLAYMALEQAFLHEFAHIGNGHNDYLSTLNLLSLTDRPYHPVAAEKDSLLLQTLEMDADATGLMYTLELNERKRLDLPKYADRLDDAKRIANIAAFGAVRAYIRNILFSNYVFWRCKDQVWDLEKQPHDDHPQPAIRMKFLRDGLARCLLAMPHLGYSPNDFITDSREIIQSAEIACARIMHVEPQLEVYQSAFQTADAVHYFEKLEDYWCKIRHSLMKYPKVRMLAPCNLPHNHALI